MCPQKHCWRFHFHSLHFWKQFMITLNTENTMFWDHRPPFIYFSGKQACFRAGVGNLFACEAKLDPARSQRAITNSKTRSTSNLRQFSAKLLVKIKIKFFTIFRGGLDTVWVTAKVTRCDPRFECLSITITVLVNTTSYQ